MTTTRREILAGMTGAAAVLASRSVMGQTPTAPSSTNEISETPGRPPSDPPRARPGQADLGTLAVQVQQLAAAAPFRGAFLDPRWKSFAEFRETMRGQVLDALSYRPEPVEPKAEVLERRDMGDHVRERIVFSTSPLFRVPAYVLIPKNLSGPAPAIVDLHSHGGMFLFGKEKVIDLGSNHPVMTEYHQRNYDGRPTSTELVRRGYVVISIDAFMFGERRVMLDSDFQHGWDRSRYSVDVARQLNSVCRGKESTIVKGLTLAGATWPGIVFWDDMRTVDYLVTRPEVDAKRIGCVGISMGGYRALYLTALDPRVRAGCVVGFMSSVRPMIPAHLDTHSFVHFLPGLHTWLDLPDVATLAADRSLLVQQCRHDRLFPLAGMESSLTTIRAGFLKANQGNRFTGRFYDEPHHFTRAMQDDAFAWFEQQLG